MAERRENLWKMTAIGVAVAAVTAVITGVVVARRTTSSSEPVTARVEQPPAASPRTSDDAATRPQPPATTAPTGAACWTGPRAAPAGGRFLQPAGTGPERRGARPEGQAPRG